MKELQAGADTESSHTVLDEWALQKPRSWHLFPVLCEGRLIDFQTDVKGKKKGRNFRYEARLYLT